MKTFTIECVTLKDVCKLNKLDYREILDEVNDSYISFGLNADTLLSRVQLEHILCGRINWVWEDTVLISLGC